MLKNESWLFLKSGFFSYATKASLLLFGFLYTYLIANSLGPDKYGVAMYILAFVSNLTSLFGVEIFGNALVVFTPKTKTNILFFKFAKIVFCIFLFVFLSFYFFSQTITAFLGRGSPELFRFSAVLFVIFPFFLLFEALFKGLKSFGKVLKVSVIESVANLCLALFFVLMLHQGIFGVILAKAIAVLIGTLVYLSFFVKCKFEKKEIQEAEVKKYLKNITLLSILKTADAQIWITYLGLFVSSSIMGLYYIGEKIVSYAIEVPIAALSETMLPFASTNTKDKKRLSKLTSFSIKFSILLGAIFGAIILLIGPILLKFLFSKFFDAYWLFPLFVMVYLSDSRNFLSNAYRCLNRVDLINNAVVLRLPTTVILGYFLISMYGVYGLLILRLVTNILVFSVLYLNQKKVGLQIEIIPRFRDLLFFASVFKTVVKRILFRLGL